MNAKKNNNTPIKKNDAEFPSDMEPIAVIDIGTNAVRLVVAECRPQGRMRILDSLEQSLRLGHDTFTTGEISKDSIQECVEVLNSFRKILREYGVVKNSQFRAVATSAVREANNQDAFLDRIYIATGINVELLDNAEVNRFTYLSVLPLISEKEKLKNAHTIILEVGAGSIEFLVLERGKVVLSQASRLGSLRMREMVENYGSSHDQMKAFMENQLNRRIMQFLNQMPRGKNLNIVAMGGDVRFAAAQIMPDWDRVSPVKLPVNKLKKFTYEILSLSVDDIVRRYPLQYVDAETIGPALLAYFQFARAFRVKKLHVVSTSMRDGVLTEMAVQDTWTEEFISQVIHSTNELGRKYDNDEPHAVHVSDLAVQLFDALSDQHQLSSRYRLILRLAGLLHDIGFYINSRSHHKHSKYLIENSELFGMGMNYVRLIAYTSRYHRRALPKSSHDIYETMSRDFRIIAFKLASILRIADALDRSHTQQIRIHKAFVEENTLVILLRPTADIRMQEIAVKEKGDMFEQIFGMNVVLRTQQKETVYG